MEQAQLDKQYIETPESLPLMDEAAILATLSYLQLEDNSYFVIGGANMVLRGIKHRTSDLDILVNQETFDWMTTLPDVVIKDPPQPAIERGADNKTAWLYNLHTLVPVSATTSLGDGFHPMSFNSHKDRVDLQTGVPCVYLGEVILSKIAIKRSKDLFDLRKIATHIGISIETILPEFRNIIANSEIDVKY